MAFRLTTPPEIYEDTSPEDILSGRLTNFVSCPDSELLSSSEHVERLNIQATPLRRNVRDRTDS